MRISPAAAMIGVLAALSGWMVRGIQFDAGATPLPPQISNVALPVVPDAEVPLQVITPAYASHFARPVRNLFAYAERRKQPVAQKAIVHAAPARAVVQPAIIVPPPVEERPRARFTHRYIGRFGPDHRPVAAFVRDGQVVTVRAGERIDDRFVLRSIDIESVQVEASVDGEVQTQRVAFDERSR
jgi:hypothetical protein